MHRFNKNEPYVPKSDKKPFGNATIKPIAQPIASGSFNAMRVSQKKRF